MTYLRKALRQIYLVFFWPTQFQHEATRLRLDWKQRISYIMYYLPFVLLVSVLASLAIGFALGAFTSLTFGKFWQGTGTILGFCMVFGAIAAARTDVALATVFALSLCAGAIAAMMSALGLQSYIAFGIASSVSFVLPCSFLKKGPRNDISYATIPCIMVGVTIGMLGSITGGLSGGIASGIASAAAFLIGHLRLTTYIVDLALSAVTYGTARLRPHSLAPIWRWYPIMWNEMIWLPLPFAGKLLAMLVRQSRKEGFRQVAFVAAERPFQRRVAVTALVETALFDLEATSVEQLADTAEKLAWTTDAPVELPEELIAALPRFDSVAGYAGQYLSLQSPYRKSEALDRAAAEVQRLQSGLIAARGKVAPRLLRIANEWSRLLELEQERSQARAMAVREIPNPFVFGNPVAETEHNVFTGRRDIAGQIESGILGAVQAPTLLLHGPRRMGKTSLLNQLPRLLGPEFAPAVVDCQHSAVTESLGSLLRYISRALSTGLKRRRVLVDPLPPAILESRTPFGVFDDWLDGLERAMPEGTRTLLCLDEYERLQATLDAGWGERFLDTLRNTLQHRPRVVLMFTGARTFAELGPAWTDRFISARRVRVGFLTHDEMVPLLTAPIPEFDMTYAQGALEAVTGATRGQPFLTQAVAFELVQLLNEHSRKEATPADAEEAVARAIVTGGEYFANVWSDAGVKGQAVLRSIARDESPPDHPAALAWLREHDVLASDGGFAVPMVERWVRQHTR